MNGYVIVSLAEHEALKAAAERLKTAEQEVENLRGEVKILRDHLARAGRKTEFHPLPSGWHVSRSGANAPSDLLEDNATPRRELDRAERAGEEAAVRDGKCDPECDLYPGDCGHCDPDSRRENTVAVWGCAPERPHESLVWAIYHAAAWADSNVVLSPRQQADVLLEAWRERWPEGTEA